MVRWKRAGGSTPPTSAPSAPAGHGWAVSGRAVGVKTLERQVTGIRVSLQELRAGFHRALRLAKANPRRVNPQLYHRQLNPTMVSWKRQLLLPLHLKREAAPDCAFSLDLLPISQWERVQAAVGTREERPASGEVGNNRPTGKSHGCLRDSYN